MYTTLNLHVDKDTVIEARPAYTAPEHAEVPPTLTLRTNRYGSQAVLFFRDGAEERVVSELMTKLSLGSEPSKLDPTNGDERTALKNRLFLFLQENTGLSDHDASRAAADMMGGI